MTDFITNLNLKKEFIPVGKTNRSGKKITVTSITVHNTSNASKGANAAAHSKFVCNTGHYMLNGKKNWVSWHFTVDDVQAIQHLPINERAIHAGPGNASSLGIEVCMHAGIDQAAANLRAARLVAKLLNDLDLPNTAVRTHKSWTNKNCPQLLLPQWEAFLGKVAAARAELPLGLVAANLFEAPPEAPGMLGMAGASTATDEELDGDIEHYELNAAIDSDQD